MSFEFMQHAIFKKLEAPPVTLKGEDPNAMRAELARRMGCPEHRVERELQRLLGKPITYEPTPKEMQELLKRDQARDANAPHLRIRAAKKKEAPCQEHGTGARATGPGPATNNDSTKDGNESSERNENV